MTDQTLSQSSSPDRSHFHVFQRFLATAVVFVSFEAYGLVNAPIPAENEDGYLSKARHVWQPMWCGRDLFLQSANPHYLFYLVIGGLTKWMTLQTVGFIGRFSGHLLIATGWTELLLEVVPYKWSPVWAAWLFLGLQSVGSFAGEWVIGGIEAKVFSYGCVFWGLVLLIRHKWILCAMCGGLAVGFHPVVGGWAVIAAIWPLAFVLRDSGLWLQLVRSDRLPRPGSKISRTTLLAGALFICLSAVGLGPVIWMLGSASSREAGAADSILVFDRLRHHLDPTHFRRFAFIEYSALVIGWMLMRPFAMCSKAERVVARFVWSSIVIASVGLLIGLSVRRVSLMKFYPFRLGDIAVPMVVSMTLTGCAVRWLMKRKLSGELCRKGVRSRSHDIVLWGAFGVAFGESFVLPFGQAPPDRMTPSQRLDWIEMCGWVKGHTGQDSLFLTGSNSRWFKWYAERAEYMNYKDVPQDAHSILEWERRRRWLSDWETGVEIRSQTELADVRRDTGVEYMVVESDAPIALEPAYRNATFAVYKLP
jgi:hypothetical protein